jgi:cytochrome c oxidase cbb3-type subunit III
MTEKKFPPEEQQEDYEIDTLTNDRLLNDHVYDGIRELDNAPPSWFNLLFIGTIAFALLYLYILWMFKPEGLVQEKEFAREMARAEQAMSAEASPVEFSLVLLTDQDAMESGRKIFNDICAVCHLVDGGGLVGPNLTDNYWIHGNTIEDLFRITTEGVIEKGMIPYRDQLTQQQRLQVSSYILEGLVGTEPAKPKAPEGELYN